MNYHVISFYQYIILRDPPAVCKWMRSICEDHHILGRILIAQEGINGAVCGEKKAIEQFKAELKKYPRFRHLTFREQETEEQTYHKLVVRMRKEMVVFGHPLDLKIPGHTLRLSSSKNGMIRAKILLLSMHATTTSIPLVNLRTQ